MKILKKVFTVILILLVFNIYSPGVAFAEEKEEEITKHEPEFPLAYEKPIPEPGGTNWTWWIIGVLVVGGGVYALIPKPPPDESGTTGTGSVTGSW